MPTIEELSALDPDLLAAALFSAQKRVKAEKLKTLPTCQCGARATQAIKPQINYLLAPIYVNAEEGIAQVGRWEDEDWGGSCPGEDAPDDDIVWVCCSEDKCVEASWKEMRAYDFSLAIRGF